MKLDSTARPPLLGVAVTLSLATLVTERAHAQFEVESPEVEAGAIELQVNSAYLWGYDDEEITEGSDEEVEIGEELNREADEAEQQETGFEVSIGYGVTDFWQPSLTFELEGERDQSTELTHVGIENIISLVPEDSSGWGLGVFFAYEAPVASDAAHALEFGPIVRLTANRLVTTVNPFFEDQFGDDAEAGVGFEYAWQTLWAGHDKLAVGFEAFGEIEDIGGDTPSLSEQQHRLGPVIRYQPEWNESELNVDLGFLFGLTEATSDYAFKLNVEYEFDI